MKLDIITLIAAAGLAVAISGANSRLAAQEDAVAEGRELAERWCASCHAVSADQQVAVDAARPFPAVAADPATTADGLRAAMIAPHPAMSDPGLSSENLDRIIAYIFSLRD